MIINAKEKSEIGLKYVHDVIYDFENKLKLQIIFPYEKDKNPCIIYIQGSGWKEQPLYDELPQLTKLSMLGYTVCLVEYRDVKRAFMPAQIIDVKNAIRFLKSNAKKYNIDENKFIVSGNSSGGHTALMVGLDKNLTATKYDGISDKINGVIDFYGPTDFNLFDEKIFKQEMISIIGEEHCFDSNYVYQLMPFYHLNLHPKIPYLLLHGTSDSLVNIAHSRNLYKEMKKFNYDVELIELMGSEHGGPEFFSKEILYILDKFIKKCLNVS